MQLGQYVFTPPSVFNYFPWDFRLPNAPGQYGPAFGVFNAGTALILSGTLSTAVNPVGVPADASVSGASGTRVDYTRWQRLAADPAGLVAEINRVLFAGAMPKELQQVLLRAINQQAPGNLVARARDAIFLAVMSPEYLVEH